jgi:hypothetical protein
MRTAVAVVLLVGLCATASIGAAPDVQTIVDRMKSSFEPDRPSVRNLKMVVSTEGGDAAAWTARQGRTKRTDGSWMVLAMLAPAEVRGVALLVHETPAGPDEQWMYLPAVRRVRKIIPVARYQSFLGSDFTYADLGFVSRGPAYRLIGTVERDGKSAYEIEEIPRENWHYARIRTWVAVDTWVPVRREFYDPANVLWKVETFDDVQSIDGIPTPHLVRMEDRQAGGWSELRTSDVRFGAELPDEIFSPKNLPEILTSPFCQ